MSWWIEVDGLVLPAQIGDHPALEWCNTRSGWGEGYDAETESLESYAHLLALAGLNDLLSADRITALGKWAQRAPEESRAVLDAARALRADAYNVFTGRASGAALDRITEAAARARARQVLARTDEGLRWQWPRGATLADPLDAFLVAAGDLMTQDPPAPIDRCPGRGCGRLFLNRSGRRRWCQMSVCGNRAKQAAHAERTKG